MLYHEATFTEKLRDWAEKTYHSTALDAAKMAKLANAKKLLLGHFSNRYKDLSEFENEAKSVFENTEVVNEGADISY